MAKAALFSSEEVHDVELDGVGVAATMEELQRQQQLTNAALAAAKEASVTVPNIPPKETRHRHQQQQQQQLHEAPTFHPASQSDEVNLRGGLKQRTQALEAALFGCNATFLTAEMDHSGSGNHHPTPSATSRHPSISHPTKPNQIVLDCAGEHETPYLVL